MSSRRKSHAEIIGKRGRIPDDRRRCENRIFGKQRRTDPELLATIPKYYKNPEGVAKKKKSNVVIVQNK